jgi:hypothetical protein
MTNRLVAENWHNDERFFARIYLPIAFVMDGVMNGQWRQSRCVDIDYPNLHVLTWIHIYYARNCSFRYNTL